MRISNSILLRGYNRNLNRLMTAKNKVEKQITTTRKFSRASESPLSAAKALNVRKSLYYSDQYKENLKVANKFYTEAETSLLQVSDKMAQVREELIAACNTTKDEQEYAIYAENLSTIARELVSVLNTDSAGRSIFGGESDDTLPFSIVDDAQGFPMTLCYHGVPINSMSDPTQFPYSNPVTIDVGLGMKTDEETQAADYQTVMDISFNGAKITGCGAEKSTADIDLSSIKVGRLYRVDVYAGNVKKTIEFTGKVDRQDNIDNINDLLEKAFSKEVAYDKLKQPRMDEQGVIYSEGSIVSAVNNTYSGTAREIISDSPDADPMTGKYPQRLTADMRNRAELLSITNDSGYTDKFRLNFAALEDGKTYSIDVTRGEITKSVEFRAGTNADRDIRADQTIKSLQDALDEAFGVDDEGFPLVAVAKRLDNPVDYGTLSAEGAVVTAKDSMKVKSTEMNGAKVESTHYDQIDLLKLNNGNKYTVTINGSMVSFTGKATAAETLDDLKAHLPGGFSVSPDSPKGKNLSVSFVDDVTGEYISIKEVKNPGTGLTPIVPTKGATYKVDLGSLTEGKEYSIKVVYNNKAKIVTFPAGKDDAETLGYLRGSLTEAFGLIGKESKVQVDNDGMIKSYDGEPISATTIYTGTGKEAETVSREVIYSNNYIQLTIDAARALREGDIDYANGCIDRIVAANEHLLVQIADLGCNEEFTDFNIDRLVTRETNLKERQNDLEITDLEYQTTLLKQYEALYNMCLQMAGMTVPNSIFNYIS